MVCQAASPADGDAGLLATHDEIRMMFRLRRGEKHLSAHSHLRATPHHLMQLQQAPPDALKMNTHHAGDVGPVPLR